MSCKLLMLSLLLLQLVIVATDVATLIVVVLRFHRVGTLSKLRVEATSHPRI